MKKRFPWFETILIVVVFAISLYAALSDGHNLSWYWFTRDDAYYYFKVAQNISEGHGSTFDGINPTNGYHPLWMLVCIPIFALARFDLILPLRVLLLVMSGLSVTTAILLYRLIGRIFAPAIGAITAVFWVFSIDVMNTLYQHGLESGIAAFFVVLLVYKLYDFEISWRKHEVSRKQIITLAVIATLAMFSRLDLVFLAGIAGLWIIFRHSSMRFLLPLDIVLVIVATLLAFILRVRISGYYRYVDIAVLLIVINLVVKISCAFLFGLYQRSFLRQPVELFKRLILFTLTSLTIAGLLMIAGLQLGVAQGSFSRLIIVIDMGLTFAFFGIIRLLFIGLRTNPSFDSVSQEKPLDQLRKYWKKWIGEGALYYSVVLGALGIYMAWSKFAFGTTSPVSGQIKIWWASRPGRAYGGSSRDELSFFGLSYVTDENAWRPMSKVFGGLAERMWAILPILDVWRYLLLLTLFAAVFYVILLANRNKGNTALTQMGIIPLLSGAWLQVLYYSTYGYAAHKEWYWISQTVITVLTFSLMLGILYTLIRRVSYRSAVAWGLAAVLGIGMGIFYWGSVRDKMQYKAWPAGAAYMDIVPLLEKHTEPDSLIGFTGGGNVGYFVRDRTIVNMDGLINSYAYFQALQTGQGGKYLHDIGLDYVLANPTILDQQPYKGQFNDYMEPLDVYYGGKRLMRYRSR